MGVRRGAAASTSMQAATPASKGFENRVVHSAAMPFLTHQTTKHIIHSPITWKSCTHWQGERDNPHNGTGVDPVCHTECSYVRFSLANPSFLTHVRRSRHFCLQYDFFQVALDVQVFLVGDVLVQSAVNAMICCRVCTVHGREHLCRSDRQSSGP